MIDPTTGHKTRVLHEQIAAAAPILGVSIGDPADKSTWRIDFAPQATQAQRQAALDAVETFDPGAVSSHRLVMKSTIIERLNAVGKLAAAKAALDSDLYRRERWYAPDQPAIHADDAAAIELLVLIGADPNAILAE